jgi:hypothetical protein
MSADDRRPLTALPVLMLAGIACPGNALAADEADEPDLEFIEYLGSWEAEEEDWVIFAADGEEQEESEQSEQGDAAPDGEKLAEVKDEE